MMKEMLLLYKALSIRPVVRADSYSRSLAFWRGSASPMWP